jgi:hypothetical protein
MVKPLAPCELTSSAAKRELLATSSTGPPTVGVSAQSAPSGTLSVGLEKRVTLTRHAPGAPPPAGASASASLTTLTWSGSVRRVAASKKSAREGRKRAASSMSKPASSVRVKLNHLPARRPPETTPCVVKGGQASMMKGPCSVTRAASCTRRPPSGGKMNSTAPPDARLKSCPVITSVGGVPDGSALKL